MANLNNLLDSDWGAKGAQLTGAQVQSIIKDALKQCAQWATEPEEVSEEEIGYVVVNIDNVPKKVPTKKLAEVLEEKQEGLGKEFIDKLFGFSKQE